MWRPPSRAARSFYALRPDAGEVASHDDGRTALDPDRASVPLVVLNPNLMKRFLPRVMIVLGLFAWSVLVAADAKPTPPAPAAKTDGKSERAGRYEGTWTSSSGETGELRIVLKSGPTPAWTAEASFTFQGNPIETQFKSIEVNGDKVKLVFSWKIQDMSGQSTMDGEWNGTTLRGAYETKTVEGATRGTWTTTRK